MAAHPFPFLNIDMNQQHQELLQKLEEINNNINKLNNENHEKQQQNFIYLCVIGTFIVSIYLTYFFNKYS